MIQDISADIALTFKIIKILIYIFFQGLFLRRASRKWAEREPIVLEVCTFLFFFCMMAGSVLEVFWLAYNHTYYDAIGALNIYFIGFIALASLSIGIERSARFKTKGLIALVPLSMAILTLIIGFKILLVPYYFIALVVAIIPGLFLYQSYVTEGLIRRQFFFIGLGYFLVFAGEALNYKIIQLNFSWLESGWINLTGISIQFLPPLLVLFGLLCLFIGYVFLARKMAF
jgi:hypothetical protein